MGNALSCVSKNKEPSEKKSDGSPKKKKGKQGKAEPAETENRTEGKDMESAKVTVVEPESYVVNEVTSVQVAAPIMATVEDNGPIFPPIPDDFEPSIVGCMTGNDVPEPGSFPYDPKAVTLSPTCWERAMITEDFKSVDERAFLVSRRQQPSFRHLIWQLIYAPFPEPLTSDMDKTRAIFIWICTKDMQEIIFDDVPPNSPEETLFGIKEGKYHYAHVFQTLCSYSALRSKLIRGYAKAYGYRPGMSLEGSTAQHAWNSVLLDGTWRLIDPYSGAHRLIGKKMTEDLVRKECDTFYYMTDPQDLKYSHLPDEPVWQLLKKPLKQELFETMTPVRPAFFKFGLELFSHPQGLINAQEQVIMKLKFPEKLVDKISFTFTLNLEGLGEIYQGSNLTRFGMHETSASPPMVTFTFRFPRSGVYRLVLYARQVGDQIFAAVCEHRIEAELPLDEEGALARLAMPFPPTQQSSYGRTEHAREYGLLCSHIDTSVVRATNGTVDIRFYPKTKDIMMPHLISRLKSTVYEAELLEDSILMRKIKERDNQSAVLTCFLTNPGEYALEVYACTSDDDDKSFFLVWQFLVVSETSCPMEGLPTLPSHSLGALSGFTELGLVTVNHKDPLIHVPSAATVSGTDDKKGASNIVSHKGGDLGIQIEIPECFAQRERLRILAQLVFATNDADDDCSEYVLQQVTANIITFLIRFQRPGYYKFHIYALPYSNPDENIPLVYTYLLHAPPRLSSKDTPYLGSVCGPFPQMLALWKEGCFLHKPHDGELKLKDGNERCFVAEILKAQSVGVVIKGEWIQLEERQKEKGIWEGKVSLPSDVGEKIELCAKYGSHNDRLYTTLLVYKIAA